MAAGSLVERVHIYIVGARRLVGLIDELVAALVRSLASAKQHRRCAFRRTATRIRVNACAFVSPRIHQTHAQHNSFDKSISN